MDEDNKNRIRKRIREIGYDTNRNFELRILKTVVSTTSNTMTSELVYLSKTMQDPFAKEYFRRLELIGLSEKQSRDLYGKESEILSSNLGNYDRNRDMPWLQSCFLVSELLPEELPNQDDLTLSELISITNEANESIKNGLYLDSSRTLEIAASEPQDTQGRYIQAFMNRVQDFGWSTKQSTAYCLNENGLLSRFKWGYHDNELWTPESTNLDQFGQQ